MRDTSEDIRSPENGISVSLTVAWLLVQIEYFRNDWSFWGFHTHTHTQKDQVRSAVVKVREEQTGADRKWLQ